MASSTIIPITKAKANRVRVSRFNPANAMTIKVPNKEIGIVKAAIAVARQFRRKGKMVITDIAIAVNKASMVA